MKRRVLTALLAVCLVFSLGTITAFADETVATADELKSAIANAQDGETITLGADIVLDPGYGDFSADPEEGPLDPLLAWRRRIRQRGRGWGVGAVHGGEGDSVGVWVLHRLGLVDACPLPFLYRGGTWITFVGPATRSH